MFNISFEMYFVILSILSFLVVILGGIDKNTSSYVIKECRFQSGVIMTSYGVRRSPFMSLFRVGLFSIQLVMIALPLL